MIYTATISSTPPLTSPWSILGARIDPSRLMTYAVVVVLGVAG